MLDDNGRNVIHKPFILPEIQRQLDDYNDYQNAKHVADLVRLDFELFLDIPSKQPKEKTNGDE